MGIPRMTGKTVPCGYCEATGRVGSGYGSYGKTMCPVCLGRGRISVPPTAQKCNGCNGTGRQRSHYLEGVFEKHNECHGTGWVTKSTTNTRLQR